jgi:deoxyribodipyrimidine photo-lyase
MKVEKERIRHFTGVPPKTGAFVLYWMQQAQRVHFNHALGYAAERAVDLGLPLAACFVVTPGFPDAGFRHYRFMLEGITEVQAEMAKLHIPFVIRIGDMVEEVLSMAKAAAWVVTDVGYLRIQKEVAKGGAARRFGVPTRKWRPMWWCRWQAASDKAEYGARTIRPKLHGKSRRIF